jgi:hypothetical protein
MELRARHHSVPQRYLRAFTDSEGFLFMYEPGNPNPKRIKTKNAAVERYLYTPNVGWSAYNDEVERVLARSIDRPGAKVTNRLREGRKVRQQDWGLLARCLGAQLIRMPGARDWYRERIELFYEAEMAEIFKRPLRATIKNWWRVRRRGRTLRGAINFTTTLLREGRRCLPKVSMGIDSIMAFVDDLGAQIAKWPYHCCRVTGKVRMVTVDQPVSSSPPFPVGFWRQPAGEDFTLHFPVDPYRVLIIGPRIGELSVYQPAQLFRKINQTTVANAKRLLCSTRPQSWIVKRLAEGS